MLVLAWDTATPVLELALVRFGPNGQMEVLGHYLGDGQASHGSVLAPQVQALLRAVGVTPGEVALLAVGLGPGSFTGLRVGLALAKGLSLATGRPSVGISSLELLAAQAPQGARLVAPLIDARHREIFWALYQAGPRGLTPLTGILAQGPDKLLKTLAELKSSGEPVTLIGPGQSLLPEKPDWARLGSAQGPSALVLAQMAWALRERGQLASHPLIPLYGRSPEIFQAWRPPQRLAESQDASRT
ncbi:MAG: tRNA (adenosine(37)-N6)-threonylcarbamoyltransferase complex dimerization subunit type 1 TsaB [Deltaproteobacteria bacterium]|nr:tRNA (adenosine(37)-N6)-threonylcarbamoyltransferase complex dimerization subunit type 1 TsaB [Deltaproteobacteria bacterium]